MGDIPPGARGGEAAAGCVPLIMSLSGRFCAAGFLSPRSPCLAELLRRILNRQDAKSAKKGLKEGEADVPGIEGLAREMGTDYQGTTLAALARVAKLNGFKARGLELTWKGLRGQALPLIALIEPGHFVLVDAVTEDSVLIWDPGVQGQGKAVARRYSLKEWEKVWNGITLVLR